MSGSSFRRSLAVWTGRNFLCLEVPFFITHFGMVSQLWKCAYGSTRTSVSLAKTALLAAWLLTWSCRMNLCLNLFMLGFQNFYINLRVKFFPHFLHSWSHQQQQRICLGVFSRLTFATGTMQGLSCFPNVRGGCSTFAGRGTSLLSCIDLMASAPHPHPFLRPPLMENS